MTQSTSFLLAQDETAIQMRSLGRQSLTGWVLPLVKLGPLARRCSRFSNISQSNGYKYDMANCLYAATVEEILDNCSCKPFFLNWQAKSTRVENSASLPFCTGPGLLCMKNKMNMWGDENRKMDRVIHYSFFFNPFFFAVLTCFYER